MNILLALVDLKGEGECPEPENVRFRNWGEDWLPFGCPKGFWELLFLDPGAKVSG